MYDPMDIHDFARYYDVDDVFDDQSLNLNVPSIELTSPMENCSFIAGTRLSSGLHEELNGYSRRDVALWTGEDCFDWAYSTMQKINVSQGDDGFDSHLHAFKYTSGAELLNFTEHDFKQLINVYNGSFFYFKFQELVEERQKLSSPGEEVQEKTFTNLENMEYSLSTAASCAQSSPELFSHLTGSPSPHSLFPRDSVSPSAQYEINFFNQLSVQGAADLNENSLDGMENKLAIGHFDEEKSPLTPLTPLSTTGETPEAQLDQECLHSTLWFAKLPANGTRKKRCRGPYVWEFLVRLLQDPRTNPRWIRWTGRSPGEFVLVKKDLIASLWGSRLGKQVTYDHFARLLRHHYKKSRNVMPVENQPMTYCFGEAMLERLQGGERWL